MLFTMMSDIEIGSIQAIKLGYHRNKVFQSLKISILMTPANILWQNDLLQEILDFLLLIKKIL